MRGKEIIVIINILHYVRLHRILGEDRQADQQVSAYFKYSLSKVSVIFDSNWTVY